MSEAASLEFTEGLIRAHEGDTSVEIELTGLAPNDFAMIMAEETYDPPVGRR